MNEKQAFYDKIYKGKPDKWDLEFRDKFAYETVTAHTNPRSILDIGCGNGHTLEYFGERANADLHGIDISGWAVMLARERVPQARIVQGDFMKTNLPYTDVALCLGTAEHFFFLADFLDRLGASCLYAYLEVPDCLYSSPDKEEGFRKTNNKVGQQEWHLKRETWEGHIKDAGFKIIAAKEGPTSTTRFVWLLQSPKSFVGHPITDNFVPRE